MGRAISLDYKLTVIVIASKSARLEFYSEGIEVFTASLIGYIGGTVN